MAITRGRTGKNTATASTTCSVTWSGGSTTTGSLLVAAVCAVRTSGGSPIITAPAGWVSAGNARQGNTGSNRTELFYKENAASESSTGNFVIGAGSSDWAIVVCEYQGVATSSSLDRTSTATGTTSTTISAGTTGSTTQADEVAVGALGTDSNNTYSSPGDSFSIVDQTGSVVSAALLERILASTTTVSASATANSSPDFSAGVCGTFKQAAGGSSNSPKFLPLLGAA